jgi:hypothetical protein
MAAAYSMDLRARVFNAWKRAAMQTRSATTFGVSRAWVHRLAQRQRETGSRAPRKQTKFRSRVLAGQEGRLGALVDARPDTTLGRAPRVFSPTVWWWRLTPQQGRRCGTGSATAVEGPPRVVNLMDALKKSLDAVATTKKKPAKAQATAPVAKRKRA